MNTRKRWAILNLLIVFIFSFNQIAKADDSQLVALVQQLQKEMSEMRQTMTAQNEKIAHLENRPAMNIAAPATSGSENTQNVPMSDYEFNQRLESALGGSNKWLKDMKQSGDLRLRYEAFDYGSKTESNATSSRNRFRYRLRYGIEKKFSEEMKVGFALASGESSTTGGATTSNSGRNIDPTSTNTSFDNNFTFKDVFIEKAFATYNPGFLSKKGILDKTEISAGKMNNPFEKGSSDLIWDRDVKPEGIYEKFDFKLIESQDFNLNSFFTAGQFVLDEDGSDHGDANLFAYQLGLNPVFYTPLFERPIDVLSAASFYDFNNYARNSNFLVDGVSSLARGNTNQDGVTTELDAGQFRVIDIYNEVAIYPGGLPVRFSFDTAGNAADAANTGVLHDNLAYGFGVKFGGIVKKGDWEAGWTYKYIGANSVVGAFNDSDFGDGHASRRGNAFKLAYALTDSLTLNGAAFLVENLNAGTHTGTGYFDQVQRRFQVDLTWKF